MENYEKRYKDALEAIKKLQEANPSDEGIQNWVNDNFPELAESEDERIRKEIIEYIKTGTYHKDWIAWLEKQNKQKTDIPKWKYKKDNAPLSKDCLILNRYGCVVKSVSGATGMGVWLNLYLVQWLVMLGCLIIMN